MRETQVPPAVRGFAELRQRFGARGNSPTYEFMSYLEISILNRQVLKGIDYTVHSRLGRSISNLSS